MVSKVKNKKSIKHRHIREVRQRKKERKRQLADYERKKKKEVISMVYITVFYSAVFIGFIYIVYQVFKELINYF
jgi:hypothetical protein